MVAKDEDLTPEARRRRAVIRAWLLVVAAAAGCGWAGWSYAQVDRDSLAMARARDEALLAGRQRIAELNSIDGEHVDAGLQRWLDASTGLLRDELRRTKADSRQRIERAATSVRGTVTAAALTALDVRAGTAQIIASVRVEITPKTGSPTTERKRYEAGLVRTSAGWKLRSLTAIPVGGA